MSDSRTLNTKRNIVWGVCQNVLSVLLPFCVRTVLIFQLGINYVGLNSFYLSILGMLGLAELGFASAVGYAMYEPIAKGETETVARLLRYFQKVYRIIGIIIFVLGLVIAPFLGYLITGERPADVNLQIAFFIYLINVCIGYLMFGYRQTLISAHQRNDVANKIQSATYVVLNGCQIVGLLLWPNFYVFLVLMPVTTIIQNLVIRACSNKLFPDYKEIAYLQTGLTKEERESIRQRVAGVFIYRTCQVTRDSCDTIFISMFLGLTVAGCYSNYFMIASSLLIVIEVICSSMTAPVGHSIVTESVEKNFTDMRLFMFMYASIAAVCLACLLCCYQPFIEMWVGEKLMLPDNIVWLLCGYFYMRIMGDIRSVYVDATGLWWKLKWRSVIESVMNVALNFALVQVLGLPGVIIATIFSMFTINYIWGSEMIFSNYFKNGGLKVFFLDNFVYLGVSAVCCLVPYALLAFIPGVPALKFVIGAALAVVCSAGIWLLAFVKTKRFKSTLVFLKFLKD